MICNKFSTAPTAGVFSIIAYYFMKYEIGWDSYVGSVIMALWIARKGATLIDIIRHIMLGRMMVLALIFDEIDNYFEMVISNLLSIFIPFIEF